MANVLVATLGETPVVVTAMVRALRELQGVTIETVHLLYPTGNDRIDHSVLLIEDHLRAVGSGCCVTHWELKFSDCTDEETAFEFLGALSRILDLCQNNGDDIYLSLAGGRKSMAALLGVISQFYSRVQGLYHLLDRHEGAPEHKFLTVEEIDGLLEDLQRATLSPPPEDVVLVSVPFQPFADADELRRYFSARERHESFVPEAATIAHAERFMHAVFQRERAEPQVSVLLSHTAFEQFQRLRGSETAKDFLECFRQMQDPHVLKQRRHGTFKRNSRVFHFFKRPSTNERPLFYTAPQPIELFPGQPVHTAVVCGLSVERENTYQPTADELLAKLDAAPYRRANELIDDKVTLVVPLGQTPMIATQTYALLQARAGVDVIDLVVIYPDTPTIRNHAHFLKQLCRKRHISFEEHPVQGIHDIDSDLACKIFMQALIDTLVRLRSRAIDRRIVLSLSGGRKGMSALTLFAAQYAGIKEVYHTLITDPLLEQQIERDCDRDDPEVIRNPRELERRFFLEPYDRSQFVLFRIPVIPIKGGSI